MICEQIKWCLSPYHCLTHCLCHNVDTDDGFTWWAAEVSRVHSGHHLHLRTHVLRQLHEGLSAIGCLPPWWQETQNQDGHAKVLEVHTHTDKWIPLSVQMHTLMYTFNHIQMSVIYAHPDRDVYLCASCLINHENGNAQSVKDPTMLKIYAPAIYSMLAQITICPAWWNILVACPQMLLL